MMTKIAVSKKKELKDYQPVLKKPVPLFQQDLS